MSTDPMESKFPANSTYSFAIDNPIYFIDPDGNEIVPALKEHSRQKIGGKTVITVSGEITVKLKVVNLSSTKVNMSEFRRGLEARGSDFSGYGQAEDAIWQTTNIDGSESKEMVVYKGNVKINFEVEVISSLDDLQNGDDVVILVDEIIEDEYNEGKDLVGLNHGNVSLVEATADNIVKVAEHEVGHGLGLKHKEKAGNLMTPGVSGNKVDVDQKGDIVGRAARVQGKQCATKDCAGRNTTDTKKAAKRIVETSAETR
jgi:hypothetical protein